jgi:uncharacterized protein YydD (DUF2326 family)
VHTCSTKLRKRDARSPRTKVALRRSTSNVVISDRHSKVAALEDFVNLQRELATLEASAAALRERYKAAEILEGESTQLDLDRVNLKRRLQEDHQQRKAALDKAILLIADAISELYDDRTGRFVVEATANGPEFRISIEGDRGGGIANIEIFCLDLALLQLTRERLGGPGS